MRRFGIAFLLAAFPAAALTAGAWAKEGGIELSSAPFGTKPGEPWTTELLLIGGPPELLAQAKPGIAIRDRATGETIDYPARATGKPGVYTVRVVFPQAGRWTVEAYDGVTGGSYDFFGPVRIVGEAEAVPTAAASPRKGSFPVLALAGGLSLLLAALAGAGYVMRRKRLALSQ